MRRLAFVIAAILFVGCGGGGGGDHPPAISNLQFSPTSATVGEGGGVITVNGSFSFTDSGGDLASFQVTTYDQAGNQIGTLPFPLSGLSGVTSGTLSGSVTFNTTNTGVFTFKIQVIDAAGSASNILQGTFPVTQVFSQADITGTWDVVSILSGGNAGWFHATGDFDASGNATAITNFLDSTGNTSPGTATLKWTIDSTGGVSQYENNVITGIHGKMSSDKKLISWIGTQDILTHTMQMTIARKRTGTVFSNADLASIPFAYHSLTTGSDDNWEYGAGNTNASGQLTITSMMLPPPYTVDLPLPNFDTLSASTTGIVTSNDTSLYGLMTDDKKVIFMIRNDQTPGKYVFTVIMVTGQMFTQADYAGTFSFVAPRNSAPYPTWAYGVGAIDAAGNGSYLSYADSFGGPSPSTYIRHLSTTGVITDPTDSTFHGQMSYNKNITTRTNTSAAGSYGMNITFR